ncbi:pullulanase [Mucilaginibacter frigoritolerans]|uniref:Pullulanase n=1 Tax=Mucilaginibacter frigoritolerans TaxID=652788 RepID=A0A562UDG3_9SPHI|nr:type I pullulanase [Mucilaginibacter frigoritolerans]TWJ03517.1 pullulanase [Mucilaginibacter frigoritolerans]
MKYLSFILTIACTTMLTSFKPAIQTGPFDNYPVYSGNDLGVEYSPAATVFKVWAPKASAVKLRLYEAGNGGDAISTTDLQMAENGVWQLTIKQDLKNKYYTFQVMQDGKWLQERPDIYAHAVGVNGNRGMVVDLPSTNPANWQDDKKPALKNATDAIIYETHIRDISISPNSGIAHKGKFLGLTETGTKSPDGEATGLDHLKELGVTHVHLLPAFDFNSVDETKPEANQYNWGYDPLNYNVPEGSYSTNPYDGNVRIKEFKQMVQALHKNGQRVILDVVYNHTSDINNSNFSQFAPGYFYRQNPDGSYSNATGCGNEVASERAMVRKFMIESVVYWAREYHLDGFRFDLMGVHDIETMNQISEALHKIDPTIIIYGEGWTAGNSPEPETLRAVKKNASKLNHIAVFSDDIRDGIKGGWGDLKEKGFVSAGDRKAESIKFGIVASTPNQQIDYKAVNYSNVPWAAEPFQTISYVSCHDDNTLFDRLKISNPNASEADLIKMDKLANAIVLTSQGISFLHSGAELLRTKQGIANSYNSPDSINQIDWSRKTKYKAVFEYYKGLIALRKNHPAFRMPSTAMIQANLKFIDTGDQHLIAYQISNNANGDSWKNILVVLNGNTTEKTFKLPSGKWTLGADENNIPENGIKSINETSLIIAPTAAYILFSN